MVQDALAYVVAVGGSACVVETMVTSENVECIYLSFGARPWIE